MSIDIARPLPHHSQVIVEEAKQNIAIAEAETKLMEAELELNDAKRRLLKAEMEAIILGQYALYIKKVNDLGKRVGSLLVKDEDTRKFFEKAYKFYTQESNETRRVELDNFMFFLSELSQNKGEVVLDNYEEALFEDLVDIQKMLE